MHLDDFFYGYCRPARKYSTFVFVLEGLVLTLTCLLICYNPRDTTEDILIKTGTLIKRHGQLEEGGGQGGAGGQGGTGGASKPVDLGGKIGGRLPSQAGAVGHCLLFIVLAGSFTYNNSTP